MLKSLALFSLVAVAVAQQSLIPSGIASACSTYLQTLNSDTELSTCTTAFSTALAAFAPNSNATASSTSVTSALTSVCGDAVTAACPKTTLARKIAEFGTACSEDLAKGDQGVQQLYDAMYALPALQKAICSKSEDGNWCVLESNLANGASAASVKSSLYTTEGGYVVPNTSSFVSNNIPFLLIDPASDKFCSACTRNVLSAWIEHESDIPYALAIQNSLLLSQQNSLFKAAQDTCGPAFMQQEVMAAGGLSSGLFGSSSAAAHAADIHGVVAALAGVASLAVALL